MGRYLSPTSTIITDLDGDIANVGLNSGLDVNVSDQTTEPEDILFVQEISSFTLAADTTASGITAGSLVYDFTATAGHGIAPLDEIILIDQASERVLQAEALNVVGNVITLDRPIDFAYPSATTLGRITTSNMAVDGSVTPQIFTARAGSTPLDFVRFIVTMLDDTSMDDGKFGGITALSDGLVFRIANSFQKTIFNFKTNGDIAQFCYDTSYASKAPGGQYGFNARITFGGPSKHGVVLRITSNDVLQWVVQDDLTNLISLRIAGEGHKTQPN
jgi:hypothetical protein